jgi:hypothetical protein
MARLWMCGFEWGSATDGVEAATTGAPTVVTTPVRTGSYAGRISSLVSGTAQAFSMQFSAANANGPYFFSVYLRIATRPSAANRIMLFATTAGAMRVAIDLNADGTLQLRDEDGTIGSASAVLALDTWYRIDLKADISPVAGSHVVEGRLTADDILDSPTVFATSSARSISSGVASVTFGGNLAAEAQTQGDWFFDDIRLNDSTGGSETGYPPAERLILLTPNADGTTTNRGTQGTDWDTGPTTGQTAYQQVDEIAPDDATTYIALLVNSTGATDRVNLYNLTAASPFISPSDTIVCTGILARVRAASAAACNYIQQLYSNAFSTESAAIGLASATWFTQDDGAPRTLKRVDYTDPDTTGAWTPAILDAVQIGVRSTDTTPNPQISAMGLYVGYTPAVTTPDQWMPGAHPAIRPGWKATPAGLTGLKAAS